MSDLTWDVISSFVGDIHSKEGARPAPSTYLLMGNRALSIISARSLCYTKDWSVFVLGANYATLPNDCIDIQSVAWDGQLLQRRDVAWFDANIDGWRDSVGQASCPAYYCVVGGRLYFETPATEANGKLVVHGHGSLPEFTEVEEDPNPLSYLPKSMQILPAYYILSELPYDPKKPMEQARKAQYTAAWNAALDELDTVISMRDGEGYSY